MSTDNKVPAKVVQIYQDISGDDPDVTEIESLCVNCELQGKTKILLTKIPFFKEVIIMSFQCDHCGFHNNELKPGSAIQQLGVQYKVRIISKKDLNRQVIQTDSASVKIPELDFEVPPGKGSITNVEGLITNAITGIEFQQPLRKIQHPELAEQLAQFVIKLKKLLEMEKPFTLIIDDPSGNSFVENPHAPNKDTEMVVHNYKRSAEQNVSLGIPPEEDDRTVVASAGIPADNTLNLKDEVLSFEINCPNCNAMCSTNMKLINIPHFKEVVIMATSCEQCGHRDNEVKSSGAIEPKGKHLDLRIRTITDLSRDVLKSETSSISIPELELEAMMGSLGGKFTTVEGLLSDINDSLSKNNPFCFGDSAEEETKAKMNEFSNNISQIISGEKLNVHLILDDPAGNSYIQDLCFPEEDPDLKITYYERNFEQNEALGLNDMKTDNY
ncbi:zinc finger protein ZPR1 [Octopus vulgaris]|uniref:Zinc finger protein ZPR1 n=1 Tax=Octopus vulgaris TaxID=6645 RepID=A0AA36AUG7_OCTVU|nr:zinc finger protein ZPR1 [Octopus vulgaris]